MIELTKIEEFKNLISNDLVLVDFNATWCGPCRQLKPILENFSKKHKEIMVVSVDVDSFPSLAKEYGVMSIPNLKLIKENKVIREKVGYMDSAELEEFVTL